MNTRRGSNTDLYPIVREPDIKWGFVSYNDIMEQKPETVRERLHVKDAKFEAIILNSDNRIIVIQALQALIVGLLFIASRGYALLTRSDPDNSNQVVIITSAIIPIIILLSTFAHLLTLHIRDNAVNIKEDILEDIKALNEILEQEEEDTLIEEGKMDQAKRQSATTGRRPSHPYYQGTLFERRPTTNLRKSSASPAPLQEIVVEPAQKTKDANEPKPESSTSAVKRQRKFSF